MKVAERLEALRVSSNLSKEALADYLETSIEVVEAWEKGEAFLDSARFSKLCVLYGVSSEELLGKEALPEQKQMKKKALYKLYFGFALVGFTFLMTFFFQLADKITGSWLVDRANYLSEFPLTIFLWVGISFIVLGISDYFKKKSRLDSFNKFMDELSFYLSPKKDK